MREMTTVKKYVICAMCIALCCVLPIAFHAIGAGNVFLPMHIPVFICGIICSWQFGLLCGILGPLLSSILTTMPPVAMLPSMMAELVVYGIVSGLLMKIVRTKSTYADLYISLGVAIVVGRIVAGLTNAFIFSVGEYSMAAWVTGYVLTSWPGTLIQLIFIPTIIFALMKGQLIPERYPKAEN